MKSDNSETLHSRAVAGRVLVLDPRATPVPLEYTETRDGSLETRREVLF
jgi:hypothetical protein